MVPTCLPIRWSGTGSRPFTIFRSSPSFSTTAAMARCAVQRSRCSRMALRARPTAARSPISAHRRRSRRWRKRKERMPSASKSRRTCRKRSRGPAPRSSMIANRRCSTSLRLIERTSPQDDRKGKEKFMRIDAYTHFIPEKFFNKIVESGHADIGKRVREIPCIHDLEIRRKIVDGFKDYAQILSYPMPPLEVMTKGEGKLTEE